MEVQKIFKVEKTSGQKEFFGLKNILDKRSLVNKKILVHKNQGPKKIGSNSLVKIRTLLIWTGVARIYVTWTNVTITVGICKRWSQEPTFTDWSKSGQ